jgi:hypothetical protein
VSWVHDTGYGLALDHDGTDPSTPPDQIGRRVIGWRSACHCGWHGTQFSLRSEWPNTGDALAPEEVEERLKAEWERHLCVGLPVLAIHDLRGAVAPELPAFAAPIATGSTPTRLQEPSTCRSTSRNVASWDATAARPRTVGYSNRTAGGRHSPHPASLRTQGSLSRFRSS